MILDHRYQIKMNNIRFKFINQSKQLLFEETTPVVFNKKQSIKNHIKEHEKNWWISEFMRLAEVNYETALKEWEKVFNK